MNRTEAIFGLLKQIEDHAGNPPATEDGIDDMIVHCWALYELVNDLQELTGATTIPGTVEAVK